MAPRLRAFALLLLLALASATASARRLRSSGDEDSETEAHNGDAGDVGVPPADTSTAESDALPDDPANGQLAPTFDVPEGQDDAEFVMGAVPVDEGEAAGYASAGAAPPDDGQAHGGAPSEHGCHPHSSW